MKQRSGSGVLPLPFLLLAEVRLVDVQRTQALRRRIPPAVGVALAATMLLAGASSAVASGQPPPGSRLLHYLWAYNNGQLRPYVSAVSLSGGHVSVANGRSNLVGATANVHETLHDQPSSVKANRFICQVAAGGVKKLHLSMISTVAVWSLEGHLVARC
jgi:hypothetical protein